MIKSTSQIQCVSVINAPSTIVLGTFYIFSLPQYKAVSTSTSYHRSFPNPGQRV